MNPVTRELEYLGWSWDGLKQVYVLSSRSFTLSYEQAEEKVKSGTIKSYTGYLKSKKRKKTKNGQN